MEQMTVRINEEECVIMPAPKGVFILEDGDSFPIFPPYLAVETKEKESLNLYKYIKIYPLEHHGSSLLLLDTKKCSLRNTVFNIDLQNLYKGFVEVGDYDMRKVVMSLYKSFTDHQTSMDYSAIKWFKEKFKEHNITKSDFDVFA